MQVFLKYYHFEELVQVLSRYSHHATVLQSVVRGYLARRKAKRLMDEKKRRAAMIIQASK